MKKYTVKWKEIYKKIDTLLNSLEKKDCKIYGIARGGQIIAGLTGLRFWSHL